MSLMSWLQAKKSVAPGKGPFTRARKKFSQTTLPLISPRRGRRILRREQLFAVVRESLIRAGVLSTSYEFKVLTLDANGDSFLVLVDLALPAKAMPDEYLLEIERWIQHSGQTRHEMDVRSVYWRRKAAHDQVGMALKAAVAAQTRREAVPMTPGLVPEPVKAVPTEPSPTAIPRPAITPSGAPAQVVGADEVEAFRLALQSVATPPYRSPAEARVQLPVPESHSDFGALSETQYGKL
ncbi:MAG: hypothetical protein KIT86_19765 [Hydrogenophaga sp.]|jgi:hypothetical protein|uniref:hypothetical protein n=1 Tax=Hydrogenophaga sp. TaxID=1904254 RepID=UPI0026141206|nr:hypothetical protein [Hydrogenophaga sp.]MCW5671901.1 hypothetical protein [Hydrogenophaga sp.]